MFRFLYLITSSRGLSLWKTLAIEVLSSLQIIYLLLKIIIDSMAIHQFTLSRLHPVISFLMKIFEISNSSPDVDLALSIWFLCGVYLLLQLSILAFTLFHAHQNKHLNLKYLEWMNIGYVLHSRLLFFIIQILLFLLMKKKSQIPIGHTSINRTVWIALTILLSTMNLGLALFKEFVLYQTTKGRDQYAAKTNQYHQAVLIYKTTALLFDFFSGGQRSLLTANSALQVLFAVTMLYILFKKLPFYEFRVLKTTMIMTAIIFGVSIVSVLHVLVTDISFLRSLDFFLLILPIFMVKIVLSGFEMLLNKILRSEFTSAEYAVHYALLLKEAAYIDQVSLKANNKLFPNIPILNTAAKARIIGYANLNQDIELQAEYKRMLAQVIMTKFEQILQIHPQSSLMLLLMANIHLKKFGNTFKAIELVKRIRASKFSLPTIASVKYFYSRIGERHTHTFFKSETRLQVKEYFNHNKIANNIKSDMLKEIDKHIEVWKEVKSSRTNMKKVVTDAEIIDLLYLKIQASYKKHYEELRLCFPLLVLMKAVYLNGIRTQPIQGDNLFYNFKNARNNFAKKNEFDINSENTGIMIISLERHKPTKVTYASGSIENIFDVKKPNIVGHKFGSIFPPIVAKGFQYTLHQYVKSPDYKLDYKTETIGMTASGNLFELEVHFCQYSQVSKDISVIVLLKKKSDYLSMLIANHDGDIIGISQKLKDDLTDEKLDVRAIVSVQKLSSELRVVNEAFNLVHKGDCIRQQPSSMDLRESRIQGFSTSRSTRRDFITNDHLITNNSGLVSIAHERDASFMDFDGNNTQRPLKTLRPLATLRQSIWTLQRVPTFTDDSEKSKRAEEAQQVYEKFSSGSQAILIFDDIDPYEKRVKVQANLSIKAHIVDGSVYKMITILGMKDDKPDSQASLGDMKLNNDIDAISDATFADEFPTNEEKKIKKEIVEENPESPVDDEDDEYTEEEYKAKQASVKNRHRDTLKMHRFSCFTLDDNIFTNGLNRVSFAKQMKLGKFKQEQDTQGSSVKASKNQGIKVLKTLEKISETRIVQPKVRFCLVTVYLTILFMIFLAGVSFYLSKMSIQNVKISIEIANTATQRLQETVRMLQYSLLVYSGEVQGITFPNSIMFIWSSYFAFEIKQFIKSNDELKKKVSITQELTLIEEAFARTITFESPLLDVANSYGELDTFTAGDILINKYENVYKYYNLSKVSQIDDILVTFNNTSNGFLLSSQQIITKAEAFVEIVTSNSLLILKIVLIFQTLALFCMYFAIVALLYVIIEAYKRLFRSLMRLNEDGVNARIDQLTKIKTLLEEDIDSKHFTNSAVDIFDNNRLRHKFKADRNLRGHGAFITKDMSKYLLKIIFAPLVLSLMFGVLYGVTLLELIDSFQSFKTINKQVSVLNEASYQANMLVCALNYKNMFPPSIKMLIYNLPAEEQVQDTFNELKGINVKLHTIFLDDSDNDKFIQGILTKTLCQYLPGPLASMCGSMYKDGSNGIIFANEDYLQMMTELDDILSDNITQSEVADINLSYSAKITPMLSMLQLGYPILVDHILEKFDVLVDEALNQELGFFLAMCIFAVVYGLFMHLGSFRKLKNVDLSRRRIIKIIPYYMVEECKMMNFYLKKDFREEADETGAFR